MDEPIRNDNTEPKPVRLRKRKRGGQKGNTNARKHGFYAGSPTTEEYLEYQELVREKGMVPELAVISLKLRKLLETDPLNTPARDQIVRMLVKYTRANCCLFDIKISLVRQYFETTLTRLALEVASQKDVSCFDFGEFFKGNESNVL